jgi:hypothetical protein
MRQVLDSNIRDRRDFIHIQGKHFAEFLVGGQQEMGTFKTIRHH